MHTTKFKTSVGDCLAIHSSDWSGPAYLNVPGRGRVELPGELLREIGLAIIEGALVRAAESGELASLVLSKMAPAEATRCSCVDGPAPGELGIDGCLMHDPETP